MDYLNSKFDLNDKELVSVCDELSLWSAPFGLKLLDAVNYRKNISALDIGFGTGFPILEIAMRLGEGSKIYGIDPWKSGIERTRMKIAQFKITNVELIDGVAENIPLPDGSMDLIVSNNGINNVNDLNRVIAECARVAKAGAQFIATMNLNSTMLEFYSVMADVLRELGLPDAITHMKEHIHNKRKPLSETVGLVERHAFKIIEVTEDQFEYKFSSGSAMLQYHFIRLAFLDSWKNIIPQDRQVEIFHEIESRLNVIAEKQSCFKLTVPFALINAEKK